MKLPPAFLEARDTSSGNNSCDCLGGGEIAGIVIGSIAGFFLLYWLLKFIISSARKEEEVTAYRAPVYERPPRSRHRPRRRSSSHVSTSRRPVSSRTYRRDYVERPAKVYVNGDTY